MRTSPPHVWPPLGSLADAHTRRVAPQTGHAAQSASRPAAGAVKRAGRVEGAAGDWGQRREQAERAEESRHTGQARAAPGGAATLAGEGPRGCVDGQPPLTGPRPPWGHSLAQPPLARPSPHRAPGHPAGHSRARKESARSTPTCLPRLAGTAGTLGRPSPRSTPLLLPVVPVCRGIVCRGLSGPAE